MVPGFVIKDAVEENYENRLFLNTAKSKKVALVIGHWAFGHIWNNAMTYLSDHQRSVTSKNLN